MSTTRIIVYAIGELEAATNGFDITRIIGRGGCGEVFRGILSSSGEAVAVKRWVVRTVQDYDSLFNEINTHAAVTHDNLLSILGFAQRRGQVMLVSPYMARGSLHAALHATPPATQLNAAAERVSFLRHLASGISALHEAHIVHRDVKSANVLIGDDGRAVLADAGLARRMRVGADESAAATRTDYARGGAISTLTRLFASLPPSTTRLN